nr:sterol desaturase family protein [Polymorphobacter sp.]
MARASLGIAALAVGALLLAERLWSKRVRTQEEPERTVRNLALGAMSLAVVAGVERPLARALAVRVEREGLGLAQALPGHGPVVTLVRDAAAMLLLDWSMYHWHVATHRVPLLWRLHRVHHVDADMDASTALRFHVVDMMVSVPLRLVQVRVFGVSPRALAIWQGWFFGSVLFHHADVELGFDRALAWVVTTPGMHDIHHRADAAALDSNYSAGLSVWDRLHGTFSEVRPDVGIGVTGDQGFVAALLMPFEGD